jgi:PPOX class probable F420-dependent enzyme
MSRFEARQLRLHRTLRTAPVVWLASTGTDGRPHLVPCWFVCDGNSIIIVSHPAARKVRNVRADPRVMLAVGSAHPDFAVELIEGQAELDPSPSTGIRQRFVEKYRAELPRNAFDPTSFSARFSTAIRVRPSRHLDWASREVARRVAYAQVRIGA